MYCEIPQVSNIMPAFVYLLAQPQLLHCQAIDCPTPLLLRLHSFTPSHVAFMLGRIGSRVRYE